jgi:hypothetical protein
VVLLLIIRTLTYTFEGRSKLGDAACEIKKMFFSFKQGKHLSLQHYHKRFWGQVEVIEQVGVTIADLSLVEFIATMNGRHGMADSADWTEAREHALAIRFIRGTNDKHEAYLTHLRYSNSYLEGNDYYAKTLYQAYHILQRREPDGGYVPRGNDHPGLAFVYANRT